MPQPADEAVLCRLCPVLFPATNRRGEPRRPSRADIGNVCANCRNRIESDLRSMVEETETVEINGSDVPLPPLYAAAYANLLPGRSSRSTVMSPAFESRLPGSTEVFSMVGPGATQLTTQALAVPSDQHGVLPVPVLLHSWARNWRDTRAIRETLPPLHVSAAIRWLTARLDWACHHHPDIEDFAADVFAMVKHLRTVAGRWRLVHRLPAPCPSCDLEELTREDGDDRVECGSCHRLWTLDDYEWLVRVLAAEQELKAKEAARAEATRRNGG